MNNPNLLVQNSYKFLEFLQDNLKDCFKKHLSDNYDIWLDKLFESQDRKGCVGYNDFELGSYYTVSGNPALFTYTFDVDYDLIIEVYIF